MTPLQQVRNFRCCLRYNFAVIKLFQDDAILSTCVFDRFDLVRSLPDRGAFKNKKAVLSQGNRVLLQLFFSVKSSPITFTTSCLRVANHRK